MQPFNLLSLSPRAARYFVLATYTLQAGLQGMTWAVPGALSNTYSSPAVYSLSGDTIQLLLNWGPIAYLLAALPVSFALDRHGLRIPVLSGIALVLAANLLRLLANDASLTSLLLLHASFFLNACAGPAAMGVPSKLAEVWFPPSERTLATGIAALGNQSGALVLYLLIALCFPAPTVRDNFYLNACLAALSVLNAAMALAYFPAHPPSAPSASAAIARSGEAAVTLRSLAAAALRLLACPPYLVVLAAYALSTGIMNCVGALLPQSLAARPSASDPAFNAQGTAGYVSLAANALSMGIGVALAHATDVRKERFDGAQKAMLVLCLLCSGCAFLAYTLLLAAGSASGLGSGALLWAVAAAYTVASLFQGASIPLLFEVGAEQTGVRSAGSAGGEGEGEGGEAGEGLLQAKGQGAEAPVPTGTMLMVLTTTSNLVSLVTLLMPSATFFVWANWASTGIFFGSAALLALLLPGSLPRFSFDRRQAALLAGKEGLQLQ